MPSSAAVAAAGLPAVPFVAGVSAAAGEGWYGVLRVAGVLQVKDRIFQKTRPATHSHTPAYCAGFHNKRDKLHA